MLMRGDMQKIVDQVNPVFETAFNRIEALDKRVKQLEETIEALKASSAVKKPVGRPKKTENLAA